MLGSLLVFFIISFFLKVLLAKDPEEIQYASITLVSFLALYFFILVPKEALVGFIPILIIIILLFVVLTLNRKSARVGDGNDG